MAVLRDVIAQFTLKVDDSQLKKLDKRLDSYRGKLNNLATVWAGAAAAWGFAAFEFTKAASQVEENTNRLGIVFKGQADNVKRWSKEMGSMIGRSSFRLQQNATDFGSFLAPMLPQAGQGKVADMSTRLTALSEDLASFYDVSSEEAKTRLFSGMAGETEAVRKLGVDLSDAALEALYKKSGGKLAYNQIGTEEKTMLRYQKMLEDTVLAQGDAARTADSFSNQSRKLSDNFYDFQVLMGQKLLPTANKLVQFINRDLAPAFMGLAERSLLMENAFEALAGTAGVLALSFGALNPMKMAAALGAASAAALFDEIRTSQKGGESIFDAVLKPDMKAGQTTYAADMATGAENFFGKLFAVGETAASPVLAPAVAAFSAAGALGNGAPLSSIPGIFGNEFMTYTEEAGRRREAAFQGNFEDRRTKEREDITRQAMIEAAGSVDLSKDRLGGMARFKEAFAAGGGVFQGTGSELGEMYKWARTEATKRGLVNRFNLDDFDRGLATWNQLDPAEQRKRLAEDATAAQQTHIETMQITQYINGDTAEAARQAAEALRGQLESAQGQ